MILVDCFRGLDFDSSAFQGGLSMVLTALLTGLVVVAGLVAVSYAVYRVLSQKLADFLTAPDESTPSPFAQAVDSIAVTFAQRFTASLKASLLGMASVDKRNEQRLQDDIVQDVATQANPMIGMLLQQFPQLRKRLAKNPELIETALAYFNKGAGLAPGNGGGTPPASGSTHSMSEY